MFHDYSSAMMAAGPQMSSIEDTGDTTVIHETLSSNAANVSLSCSQVQTSRRHSAKRSPLEKVMVFKNERGDKSGAKPPKKLHFCTSTI